ncbi:salicylate hydroxylase [Aspergillus granulosus]|uniref:Salicylate hydroxylase n=1 Tax=Aspergillus granulosus TaxID=176169 RepID=A0ABR4GZ33_9EURO
MPDIKKAIILGAGPTGLSTALLLTKRNNIAVTIYELRPALSTIGGAIGIPSNGTRLLHRLDDDGSIYSALTQRAPIVPNLILYSASQGSSLGEANWTEYSTKETGFGYMRVKRTDLTEVLFDAVRKERIDVRFGKRVVSIRDDEDIQDPDGKITVTFDDGSEDTADLLIGADGIHSAVRNLFVDPAVKQTYTGIAATFSSVKANCLPENLRLEPSAMHSVLTTQGLFAVIPCTPSGDELFWFFSRETLIPDTSDSECRDGWEMRRREEVSNFKDILQEYVSEVQGQWGAVLQEIISRTDTIQFFPVYRLPSGGRWTRGRCILLGDAAHAMPPHAGQGVSMALEDAFALSGLLRKEGTLEEVWERYESVRRPRVEEITRKSEKNSDMRKRTGPWGLWMKEIGLSAGLWVYSLLGLGGWGFGQGYIVYDIEKEI